MPVSERRKQLRNLFAAGPISEASTFAGPTADRCSGLGGVAARVSKRTSGHSLTLVATKRGGWRRRFGQGGLVKGPGVCRGMRLGCFRGGNKKAPGESRAPWKRNAIVGSRDQNSTFAPSWMRQRDCRLSICTGAEMKRPFGLVALTAPLKSGLIWPVAL